MNKLAARVEDGLKQYPEISSFFNCQHLPTSLVGLHNSHPILRWAWLPQPCRGNMLSALNHSIQCLQRHGFADGADEMMTQLAQNAGLFYTRVSEIFMAAHFLREGKLRDLSPLVSEASTEKRNDFEINLGGESALVELYTPGETAVPWEWGSRIHTIELTLCDACPAAVGHYDTHRLNTSAPTGHDINKVDFNTPTSEAAAAIERWYGSTALSWKPECVYDSGDGFTVQAVPKNYNSQWGIAGEMTADLGAVSRGFFRKAKNGQLSQSALCIAATDLARTRDDADVHSLACPAFDGLADNPPSLPREVDVLLVGLFELSGKNWGNLRWLHYTPQGEEALRSAGVVSTPGRQFCER